MGRTLCFTSAPWDPHPIADAVLLASVSWDEHSCNWRFVAFGQQVPLQLLSRCCRVPRDTECEKSISGLVHSAAARNRARAIEDLHREGHPLDRMDHRGMTPAHIAA